MAFDIELGKMAKLCEANALKHSFDGTKLHVTLTIRPDAEIANQLNMFDHEQIDEGAEIRISFIPGNTTVEINGHICVSLYAFKKIVNQAKDLYIAFLQDVFEARMQGA